MKYPNAARGLQTMIKAEILAAASAILTVIVYAFTLNGNGAEEPGLFEFGAISIVMLVIVVMFTASFVLEIIGIIRAGRDEPAFLVSLNAVIAAIILTILSGFFYNNETISFIIAVGGDVAQFFLVHYIIHGIMHLSDHLGKPDVHKSGKKIFTVIYIGIIFEVIVRIFDIIFGHKRGEELATPFIVAASILKSAEYIMFLIYIVKGYKMLRESSNE